MRIDLPAGTAFYRDEGLQAATTYYYRLSAWNPNGNSAWVTAQATTLDAPPPPALSLSASGYKVKGVQHVALEWSGSGSVDVYRNDLPIATGVSANSYDDGIGGKGAGSYRHYVCEADTTNCSNTTLTVF